MSLRATRFPVRFGPSDRCTQAIQCGVERVRLDSGGTPLRLASIEVPEVPQSTAPLRGGGRGFTTGIRKNCSLHVYVHRLETIVKISVPKVNDFWSQFGSGKTTPISDRKHMIETNSNSRIAAHNFHDVCSLFVNVRLLPRLFAAGLHSSFSGEVGPFLALPNVSKWTVLCLCSERPI